MRMHELGHVVAALTSAIVSTSGCLSHTPVAAPLVIPPLSIPEPSPPPIDAPSPEQIAANLPDQCPPSSKHGDPSYEPQVLLATAGALPLVAFYPDYPLSAGDRCISGWAAFRFNVSHDGHVENPELVTAHPQGVFDRPSLAALKKSRYNRSMAAGDRLASTGGCALFLFHHPLHPLDAEAVAVHFPIRCPFPAPVTNIPRGPFPRGPLEALLPYPFAILE